MSAAQRLLQIPELLEVVLLELQPQELLLSQRVSRSFKQTIEGSTKLQQKLFYQRDPTQTDFTTGRPLINYLMWKAIQRFAKIRVEISYPGYCENPKHSRPHSTPYCISVDVKEILGSTVSRVEQGLEAQHESWQEMYVTDRPVEGAIETDAMHARGLPLPLDAKMSDLIGGLCILYEGRLIGEPLP
jgi:hypothetical protein